MGVIFHPETQTRIPLRPHHVVGREARADLCLPDREISASHALLRWSGTAWELRDLGSRNGTWVGGRRLQPGERCPLKPGDTFWFGNPAHTWSLEDAAPPCAAAVCAETQQLRQALGGLLVLPDESQPLVSIYLDANGQWVMEADGEGRPVTDQAVIEVAGQRWRLFLGSAVQSTIGLRERGDGLEHARLRFEVSTDEEHVHLWMDWDGRQVDLGERAHHYLLLTLARVRQRDQRNPALHPDSHGWLPVEDLQKMLAMDSTHLRVEIFRIRRQLVDANIDSAASIIERRMGARQLRIGVEQLDIQVR